MWLYILLLLTFFLILDYFWKREINAKLLSKLPGPLNLPIIGCIWVYYNRKPDALLEMAQELNKKYGRTTKSWVFHIPAIFTSDVNYIQELLSHPVEIKKNRMYSLLSEWLGEGLLMSYGLKWLKRRRAITPTFHFKILEEFSKIFDRQAKILVEKLSKHVEKNGEDAFDVHNYVGLATLDVICETAMGVQIHAQTNENCEYVRNILEMINIFLTRFINMAYRSDLFFKLLAPKLAKRQQEVQNALHEFTERIIVQRRQEMLESGEKKTENVDSDIGIKDRMALLDVLLSSTIDGKPLSNADIREEVDTFMFEGHDTTKSAIGFTLYSISRNPEVQTKLFAEIEEVIGTDTQQDINYRQLMDLKYTEKVIKEALRMYPPVPFIGRQITQDCQINGVCLPKGLSVLMALIQMQNDETYFPEPHRFLPERIENENAFAQVPFSAGPRNCIGQRFAMLEVKAFIARTVQSFVLLPLGEPIKPVLSIVLKSRTGWQMGFRKRQLKKN